MPMDISMMELHAAEALLQLQGSVPASRPPTNGAELSLDTPEDLESAATLIPSCLAEPRTPSSSTTDQATYGVKVEPTPRSNQSTSNTASQTSFGNPSDRANISENPSTSEYISASRNDQNIPLKKRAPKASKRTSDHMVTNEIKTRDVSIQTDQEEMNRLLALPSIEEMSTTIMELSGQVELLEEQVRLRRARDNSASSSSLPSLPSPPSTSQELDPDVSTDLIKFHLNSTRNTNKRRSSSANYSTNTTAKDTDDDMSDYDWRPAPRNQPQKKAILHPNNKHARGNEMRNTTAKDTNVDMSDYDWRLTPRNQPQKKAILYPNITHARGNEMIPIGDGYASVPARVLRSIDWNFFTVATRKLLASVFGRRILASHSLTGRPSPAFPDKPAKKQLDPNKVNDIIQVVTDNCDVSESLVRTSITTKCADESKMFRTRQKHKCKRKANQENIPPASESTD